MLITKQVEFINNKKFAKTALDENIEVFVVYMTFLLTMAIYPARKTYITLFFTKKVKILAKYTNFSNVFFKKNSFGVAGINQTQLLCH